MCSARKRLRLAVSLQPAWSSIPSFVRVLYCSKSSVMEPKFTNRIESIGVGNGLRRPRPPNRACGSPAHGSPVGGFHIEIGSLTHGLQNRVNTPCAAKKALAIASSDVVTLRRQHALTPHRSFHARPISAACLFASRSPFGHWRRLLSLCLSVEFTYPPSCLPSLGAVLLSALLAAYHRCGTMKALTPAPLTDGPGLPAYYATPSC